MTSSDKAGDLLAQIPKSQGLPPVHLWNPDFCGDIDMRIARDGTWYYMGTPITRPAMVRLFSTIIRRDGEQYFLVTPVEKVGIRVDDAPFVITRMEVEGQGQTQCLRLFTQVDDELLLDAEHPLLVSEHPHTGEPAPYVRVRSNLDGLVHRNVFYQMVDLSEPQELDGEVWFGVWSAGQFFALGRP